MLQRLTAGDTSNLAFAAAVVNVTCIPSNLFRRYGPFPLSSLSDGITMSGVFLNLVRIEANAFREYKGVLNFHAKTPKLEVIGVGAFFAAGTFESRVQISSNRSSLTTIGEAAFRLFPGSLTFANHCPSLVTIGRNAFSQVIDTDVVPHLYGMSLHPEKREPGSDSTIDLDGLEALVEVGEGAFAAFPGKIRFLGQMPMLTLLGNSSFQNASNIGNENHGNNLVDIECRGDVWTAGAKAFEGFVGAHDATGEGIACSNNPTPTATSTTTATTLTPPIYDQANSTCPSQPKGDLVTNKGNGAAGTCTFPFTYENTTYNSCAALEIYGGVGWCAWDATYKYSRWGYCTVGCKRFAANTTASITASTAASTTAAVGTGKSACWCLSTRHALDTETDTLSFLLIHRNGRCTRAHSLANHTPPSFI
jgi:hypothetical protein